MTEPAHTEIASTTTLGLQVPSPIRDWHADHKSHLTRGERAADVMRNRMGSWGFVAGFVIFMIVWAVVNTVSTGWDPYPFILLNLFLSMLAGLQGAILLIAAKRQDAIAAALSKHDYETNRAAKTDIESLIEVNNRQLVIITELQQLLSKPEPALTKPEAKKR